MKSRSPVILLCAGGLTWLLGQAVLPDMGLQTPERYDAVANARNLEALSAGLLVIAGCLLVLGALLFYVSDAVLGWTRFVNDFPRSRVVVMTTYHLGQVGLVLALI